MVAKSATTPHEVIPSKSREREWDHGQDSLKDQSFKRTVETEPLTVSTKILAVGAAVPLGLAGAALATTLMTNYERVAIAAWVAVAVVGSASVISAAAVSHRRTVAVERNHHGEKLSEREESTSRTKTL